MVSRSDLANAIRVPSMDAVQKANLVTPACRWAWLILPKPLWRHHLKHSPANPGWFDRDRFVLSNGHGSMLLYSPCTCPATTCRLTT